MWEPFYILPQGLMNVLEVFTRQCTLNLEESRNILLINECFSNGNTRREMELGTNAIVEAKKNIHQIVFWSMFLFEMSSLNAFLRELYFSKKISISSF
ncbi:unnamed protein product, partial [Vitis vinifera]|uniref:Uncharacterized protein n=1 Tax=Vitis vinifera TaxID=29760 RepID=E0CQJ0_VITVI